VLAVLAACEQPDPDDFDATCVVDDDCAVVVDQGFCGACSTLTALTVDDADVFERRQARYDDVHVCRGIILPGCSDLDVEGTEAWCDDGTCATRARSTP
jgi:hypothetical protein